MPKYKITVQEIKPSSAQLHPDTPVDYTSTVASSEEIYSQTVDNLDMARLMQAVNYRPRVRKPRQPKVSAT